MARRGLGSASVAVVTDPSGNRYVLKKHTAQERFDAEVHAYRTWVPSLGGHAPRLLAADPDSRSLVLSFIPGTPVVDLPPGTSAQRRAFAAAGETLRRLHQIPPGPRPSADVPLYLANRMRWWTARARDAGLISPAECHELDRTADRLARTVVGSTICHLDYQPRNWLLTSDGSVCVVDFEHTRRDARVRDLVRLEYRWWRSDPRLREAFFAGYGHHLGEAEAELMIIFGMLDGLTSLVRGDQGLAAYGRTLLAELTSSRREAAHGRA
ncbi:aminoglycoside phosphotransferase family protein [Thermoactinospora rubra]|uniref:phosphotransferase family protein n=1 Tax=Thermoactinospora rubra TaxID=1088767 RepID=UPI0030B80A1E